MNPPNFRSIVFLLLLVAAPSGRAALISVPIVNPGFNDQSGWIAENDAVLGNKGGNATPTWSWNTPIVGSLVIESEETVLPSEGSAMGLTYGGRDSFSQEITLPATGLYEFRVKANALQGTIIGANFESPLTDGLFRFSSLGVRNSPDFEIAVGDGWNEYSWTTDLNAGTHEIAIVNAASRVYSIGYDEFSLTLIPEPSAGILALIGIGAITATRRRIRY